MEIIGLTECDTKLDKLIDRISQSYCEVIVTIGLQSSLIANQTAIPVIEYTDDRLITGNQFVNDYDVEGQGTNLSVAKILAINNPFIWAQIKTKLCYKSLE